MEGRPPAGGRALGAGTGRPWRSGALARDGALLATSAGTIAAGVGARLAGAAGASDALFAACALLALAVTAGAVAAQAWRRRIGVDVLAVLALVGTLAVRELAAGAVVGLMVATGRVLEARASERAARDLRHLLEGAPLVAHRYEGGALVEVDPGAVEPGDLLLVKPGEVVPVDGRVASSEAAVDASSITGEPLPVALARGEVVASGSVNVGGAFDLRAVASMEASTFAAIVRLVRRAVDERPPAARLADRLAAGFVPLALALAGGAWAASGSATRAVAVIVVATPCPLLLAVPVAIVSGLSTAARRGVIVKGGGVLERLAQTRVVVLDKTGTVTRGAPRVREVVTAPGTDEGEVLRLAASLEQHSAHLLASAVVREASARGIALEWPGAVEESVAGGVAGEIGGRRVRVGRLSWLGATEDASWVRAVRRRIALEGALSVFVEVDGRLAGAVVLDDPLRPDAARSIRALRELGVSRVVMATGDREPAAEAVGAVLGVDEVLAERSPEEKVAAIGVERAAGTTVMVGDGVNDAPALAAADVGVALGGRGASASSDAADVVLTLDRLDGLVATLRVARRARRIALESAAVGMALSLVAMVAAALGRLPPLAGAILQEGIDVVAIANALRAAFGERPARGLVGPPAELARRLEGEHRQLADRLARGRALADSLGTLAPEVARAELRALCEFLERELLPHERLEEEKLYPAVARVLGGRDPTGPMSRSHVEIAHLARLLAGLSGELDQGGPDDEQQRELARLLYGLDALVRLHNAQEEEAYFSLASTDGAPAADRVGSEA